MPETETWRYRGQTIDREQISFLREFIREHPHSSRWKLSRQLCEALGWKQANGALRDVVCRGLMLMLARAGEIELPPVRRRILGQRRPARTRPPGAWRGGGGGALVWLRAGAGEMGCPPGRRRILGQRRTARPRPEAVL